MYRKEKKKNSTLENTPKGKLNTTLLYIFLGLTVFGILMVFDASVYKAFEVFNDQFYFVKQHIIWLLIGGIAGFIAYKINYKWLLPLAIPLMIGTIVMLVAVLVLGNDINGAKRWFEIAGITIQPAEFAKIAMIIYLAAILSKNSKKNEGFEETKKEFYRKLLVFSVSLIFIVALIMLEPDMGTSMVICITAFLIFFLSGNDSFHTIGSLVIAFLIGLIGIIAGIAAPYRFDRIQTYLHLLFKGTVDNPTGEGYQIQQILIGIGSSGFWGKGFGQSRQRFGYLVENTAFTDSIFAVILEELGFASAVILVGVWLAVLWQGLISASRIEDSFGRLLASGITIWLVSQALLNMAANVALIPLTGIPFPLLTYGGSNTIVTMIGIGILLNTTRYAKIETK